ncbi:hypothetical protein GWI33_018802 [Rhynchophorus ferrugineus]|uniref:Uncharacterized protein n=1 Tax=Rhynchophorus ferrugineus TaxID=354439 RepID=A0A834M138_RHYFE|nr:hypothetical protein GWI33_018802 [Rhynchophorus ferrugineus]
MSTEDGKKGDNLTVLDRFPHGPEETTTPEMLNGLKDVPRRLTEEERERVPRETLFRLGFAGNKDEKRTYNT